MEVFLLLEANVTTIVIIIIFLYEIKKLLKIIESTVE